ncbi:CDP-glycerol glycerophosphotransferase, TagB/SpsB family [Tessaracoccus bendigoensis DSM 12906]|uniref:CDP-glycerol glycerophosphotransferase, TagB/SpsB family n=1 Tax=Tessaracoccus bendigoensis DSM 12906 TaxID=1123357 RepID=A0A1M6DJD2_9ACTN|nr:CDP-glycerol glycerophosphotransferase family protein [Tessaracoccus bendigoensis]SHI73414.1 CDP-glycerol glycerophosphotransferase, TagB/SpsB family [Tessaracoccus bendigoensis DSM 12906]
MTSGAPAPLISIIIPAYNAEGYLGQAIQSVLDQQVPSEMVEVVVVDDGSTDDTASVCETYESVHPGVVKCFSKPNGGVSSALNRGVREARGEILGFLGADDLYSDTAIGDVANFFAEHGDEVDLVAIGLHMFGTKNGPHWNNRSRFDTTRVIDVEQEWNLVQPHGGGSFIRAAALDGLAFDERLFISEDQTLNTQVILKKMKYGVVAGPRYLNRRHAVGGSLVSGSQFRSEYYTEVPALAYQRMLDAGRELHGATPRYAQAMVAYDLSWRVRGDLSMMDPALEDRYRADLRDLLRQLDVEVIMAQRAPIEVRLAMLNLREDGHLAQRLVRDKRIFRLDGFPVYSFEPRPGARHRPIRCDIDFFEPDGDDVVLEGRFRAVEIGQWSYGFEAGERYYPAEILPDTSPVRHRLADDLVAARRFRVRVRLAAGEDLRAVVHLGDGAGDEAPVTPRLNRFTRFAGSPKLPYYRRDGHTLYTLRRPFSIARRHLSVRGMIMAEVGLLLRGVKGRYPKADLLARVGVLTRRLIRRKDIWLIADHKSEAGDNGEALFRYLAANPVRGIEPRFVLSRCAGEYKELSRLGVVLEPGSRKHIRSYLDAAVVLNSAGDDYMVNLLGASPTMLNDLVKSRSVFLQHGVTKDDQSAWLNRPAKGFDLFVTSAERERESILNGPYGYRPEQVALTGMPRFDRLENDPDRLIVFAPTWRRNLSGALDKKSGRVQSAPNFAESDYFQFWQGVIGDRRLNDVMRACGYRGVFALHPSHAAEAFRFRGTDRISIGEYPHDYRDFFAHGEVLVTDYSSVAFDFAYLRKPVVYVQGDREEFFGGHLYREGYFSYDDDGFGPVVATVPELVDTLRDLIVDSCAMPARYRDRVDSFFAFSGGGNSQRLVEAIQDADRSRRR